MSVFEKGGKKKFHMNPQMGKSLYGEKGGSNYADEEKLEEKVSPGIHDKVEKLEKYDGHEHEGNKLAHHVELHHGGHPSGEPPAEESHTHHTITHPHPEHGSEPEIRNHGSAEEAHQHMSSAMHETCPMCGQEISGGGESGEESGEETSEGY